MIKKTNDVKGVYQILNEAFPVSELRTYDSMKKVCEEGLVDLYGYYEKDVLLGAMMVWNLDEFLFLENFAIARNTRGKGIGSNMLKGLAYLHKHMSIILEVEEPYDDMSQRRIGFYERNNFVLSTYGYKQPQINEECNDIPLLLMGNGVLIEKYNIKDIKNKIFEHAYNKENL